MKKRILFIFGFVFALLAIYMLLPNNNVAVYAATNTTPQTASATGSGTADFNITNDTDSTTAVPWGEWYINGGNTLKISSKTGLKKIKQVVLTNTTVNEAFTESSLSVDCDGAIIKYDSDYKLLYIYNLDTTSLTISSTAGVSPTGADIYYEDMPIQRVAAKGTSSADFKLSYYEPPGSASAGSDWLIGFGGYTLSINSKTGAQNITKLVFTNASVPDPFDASSINAGSADATIEYDSDAKLLTISNLKTTSLTISTNDSSSYINTSSVDIYYEDITIQSASAASSGGTTDFNVTYNQAPGSATAYGEWYIDNSNTLSISSKSGSKVITKLVFTCISVNEAFTNSSLYLGDNAIVEYDSDTKLLTVSNLYTTSLTVSSSLGISVSGFDIYCEDLDYQKIIDDHGNCPNQDMIHKIKADSDNYVACFFADGKWIVDYELKNDTGIPSRIANFELFVDGYESCKSYQELANVTIEKINAIGIVEYTAESKALIDDALASYEALSGDSKILIPAEAKETLDRANALYNKVDKVVADIDAIGMVEYTQKCKDLIDLAKDAFLALSEDAKLLVPTDNTMALENAEAIYNSVDVIVDKIESIGTPNCSSESRKKVSQARDEYDSSATLIKELVPTEILAKLISAEDEAYLEHDYEDEYTIDIPPTCVDRGLKSRHCRICDDVCDVTKIDELGHDYDITYTWSENNDTCTADVTCKREGCAFVDLEISNSTYVIDPEPLCEVEGNKTYTSIFTNEIFEAQTKNVSMPAKGHSEPVLINYADSTTEQKGYTGDYICPDCEKVLTSGRDIPIKFEDNEIEEAANAIYEIIAPTEEFVNELVLVPKEDIVTISGALTSTMDFLEQQLASADISEDEYEKLVDAVVNLINTAVEVSASKTVNCEKAIEVVSSITPVDGVDLGDSIGDFCQKQFDLILAKNSDGSLNLDLKVDYEEVLEMIDTCVNNMIEAAYIVKECSSEKISKQVKDYIQTVSVMVFTDFDKEAADAEFVKNAYTAILINLQEQTLAALNEAYNKSKNKKAIQEQYDLEVEAVSDLETFEFMVIEVMRLKYNIILENRLNSKEITKSEYDSLLQYSVDLDAFEPVYMEIFKSWALNYDNDYSISLEELSKTMIEDVVEDTVEYNYSTKLSNTEVVVIAAFASAIVSLLGAVGIVQFLAWKRRL